MGAERKWTAGESRTNVKTRVQYGPGWKQTTDLSKIAAFIYVIEKKLEYYLKQYLSKDCAFIE